MKFFTSFLPLAAILFFFPPAASFAATYPDSCPAEAQAIVTALGGCSSVSETDYGAIYSKCCSVGGAPDTTAPDTTTLTAYYIKTTTANVRKCADLTCQVIGQLEQNTEIELPYASLTSLPEWVAYQFNGTGGYISKTVLSKTKSASVNTPLNTETVPPQTPETPETPETPPENSPPAEERALPTILVITGILMWLVAILAFMVKIMIKWYLFWERKFPGFILPQRINDFLVERDPRWSSFLHQLIKNFLIWGTLAFAIGLGTV